MDPKRKRSSTSCDVGSMETAGWNHCGGGMARFGEVVVEYATQRIVRAGRYIPVTPKEPDCSTRSCGARAVSSRGPN